MPTDRRGRPSGPVFDDIGVWTEIKLEILRKYLPAYTAILAKQRGLRFAYVDAFAGSGIHRARRSGELVPGSPLRALATEPRFQRQWWIDLDGDKVDQLRAMPEVVNRPEVEVIAGDANQVLLNHVFPQLPYKEFWRAVCLLDPYGLHLDWEVISTAGHMKSIEIFINFPIMDANRNALWRHPDRVKDEDLARMTAFWGDDSWRRVAYSQQGTLFGSPEGVKLGNTDLVAAFRERLIRVAGFAHVPEPLPMRNSTNAVVYYLFFASPKEVAGSIVDEIMARYRSRGVE